MRAKGNRFTALYSLRGQTAVGALALLLILIVGAVTLPGPSRTVPGDAQKVLPQDAYGRLPLYFIKNEGQLGDSVKYYERGLGHSIFFTDSEILFQFTTGADHLAAGSEGETRRPSRDLNSARHGEAPGRLSQVRLYPVSMQEGVSIEGLDPQEGKVNYFIGKDPAKWKTSISTYGSVVYREAYAGVDIKFYGSNERLEYDVIVNAGADPSQVRFGYSGIQSLGMSDEGDLHLVLPDGGTLIHKKPLAYQEIDGKRHEVAGAFAVEPASDKESSVDGGAFVFGFKVAAYNPAYPLVIDPVLVYSSYLGGSGSDTGHAIAVDTSGYAYVTGRTYSSTFPTASPLDGSLGGATDVFVTKLNLAGTALVYSTYLGGSGSDSANAIAVDSSNCAYLTGETTSTNFPTSNPYSSTLGGEGYSDAFVVKLSASGAALTYSTYLGGSLYDAGLGITVDSSGRAYVTGETSSTNFPIFGSALQSTFGGGYADVFVTIFTASGNALDYSTYVGGNDADSGYGIAVDTNNIYVVGETASTNFPTSGGMQDFYGGGDFDAFVLKIARSNLAVVYATYLGGSAADYGRGIAVDSGGSAYVTGTTSSANFPVANAVQEIAGGGADAFVTKLTPSGDDLSFSSYLGGAGDDIGYAIAVDTKGNAYVVGKTSGNFPTSKAVQSLYGGGGSDAFVTRIACTEGEIAYSTYLGGTAVDVGHGIAVSTGGNVYVTGWTSSYNFPTTSGTFMETNAGGYDVFVTKLNALLADFSATPTSGLYPLTVAFTDTSEGTVATRLWAFGDGSSATTQNPTHTYASAGTYTVSLTVTGTGGTDTKTRSGYIKVAVPEVTISATTPKVPETGGGNGQFTVYRSAYTSVALTVSYTVNGTATSGTDYTPLTGSVTIPVGASSAAISVAPIWDKLNDGNETVVVTLSNSTLYSIGSPSSATVTIVDHDLPTVTVSASVASVAEKSPQTGLFVVSRAGVVASSLTVYYTVSGTAVAGTDYTALSGSVTIPAGSTTANIAVTPLWDQVYDGDKTVVITLSTHSLYELAAPSSATVTVVDSDLPIVTITAAPSSIPESGSQPGHYIVTHTGTTSQQLIVKYTVSGTGVSGVHFVALTGTVTILAGSSSASITLTPIRDFQYSGDHTVVVSLSSSAPYLIGDPNAATITISESDLPTVTVSATQPNATEATVAGQFTVYRTGVTSSALTVAYTVAGTAVGGVNYTTLPGSVTIPVGAATAAITVQPLDESLWQGPTTVVLTLATTGLYNPGTPASATVTIADNDGPTVTIAATRSSVAESDEGKGQFTVTRSAHTDVALTVSYTVSGTATSGADYVGLPGSVNIPAGYASGSILVTPLEDFVTDGDKTVVVTITGSAWYKVGSPSLATVTILDSDLPTVTIAATVSKVFEKGSQPAQFTLTRSGSTTSALAVSYTTGGPAISGVDYTAPSGTVTIPAGSSSATVAVTPLSDGLYDGNQTLMLMVVGSPLYNVGSPSSASATIVDQDVPTVTITASVPTVSETASASGQFLITHSGITTLPFTVNYSVGGTATNGVDFNSLTGTVTIPAGSSSAPIFVVPIDDSTADDAETVIVTLLSSSLYSIGSPNAATVTIYETGTPTVSIVATIPMATEGSTAGQFTVYRTKMTTQALTVAYSVGGTATSGVHYAALSGTVTLPVGAASANIVVQPVENSIQEGAKTVVLTLLSGQLYLVGSPNTATVTIADNDGPTVMMTVVKNVANEEGQVPAQVKVSRPPGNTVGDLPVTYTMAGTATNGVDFVLPGTIVIPDGSDSAIIELIPVNDDLDEARETVLFTLVNNGWYQIGWPYTATIYIADNDPPKVTVVATDNSAAEADSSTGKFTITREGLTTSSLIVYYTLGGTATNGKNYQKLGSSVTIPTGFTTAEVVVIPTDDQLYSGNQTVIMTLKTSGVYNIASPDNATIILYDNEVPTVTASAPVGIIDENGTNPGVFRISRNGNSALSPPLTVSFSLGGTATEGLHYVIVPSATITIPAGSSSADIQVLPLDDNNTNGTRSVVLTVLPGTGFNVGSSNSATVSILDNEKPKISIMATKDFAVETGTDPGKVTVYRTAATNDPLNVLYTVGGTAVPNTNYHPLPGNVTIPAQALSVDIMVVPMDDNAMEPDRSVVLTLSSSNSYYVSAPNEATVAIIDDEMPQVSITALSNATETGTVGQFKVSRLGSCHFDLLVDYTVGGTAFSGIDYLPLSGSVTLPGGQTSATIDVTPIDDNQTKGNVKVELALSAGSAYTLGSSKNASIIISDDELPEVQIVASHPTASEDGAQTGVFTVSRTKSTTASLKVYYKIGGTAKNGTDYQKLSGSVIIPKGSSSQVIKLTPISDNQTEADETVQLTLTANAAYKLGTPSAAVVTISPTGLPEVTLGVADGIAAKPSNQGTFRFRRTGPTTSALKVNYTIAGTAKNGVRYKKIANNIIIPKGSSSVDRLIIPLDDNKTDPTQTVILTLVSNSAYEVVPPKTGTVTILGDTLPQVSVVASIPSASETGPTTGEFQFSRTGATTSELLISYSLGGTAKNGTDYVKLSATATIPAGAASKKVTVTPLSAQVGDGDKNVILTIQDTTRYLVASPRSATVNIADKK